MSAGILTLMIASILVAPVRQAVPPISEKMLLGGWLYVSGDTEFEQMAFDLEDGKRIFHSWLHERPEHMGTWKLKGDRLSIRIPTSPDFDTSAHILALTAKQLKIRFDRDSKPAVFKKVP